MKLKFTCTLFLDSATMGTRVYIGGLPYRVKERDIERFFRGYGKLREVLIKNGYGFVVSAQSSHFMTVVSKYFMVGI